MLIGNDSEAVSALAFLPGFSIIQQMKQDHTTENKVLGLNVTSAKYKELYKLQPKRKTENEVLFFELTIMNFI